MDRVALDQMSAFELVSLFNREDKTVAESVETALPIIAQAVERIVDCLRGGGRMFYIGSGSGGKIGILDASECPPTFGVDDDTVIAILSGGASAAVGWLEETEDNEALAVADLQAKSFCRKDLLVGITASGTTPYTLSGLAYANQLGAFTVGVCNNPRSKMELRVDLCITVPVGDEILRGSTRLKAGTAQKMVLNMLSSCAMMKLGKTYKNFMIGVRPINKKLQKRIIGIIMVVAEVTEDVAQIAFAAADGDAKAAVLMLKKQVSREEAERRLAECEGFLSKALGEDVS